MSAYDSDFHGWANAQADALRRRSANEVDWENVAEEIESLGGQQEQELYNRLHVLLTHLLKWAFQPERRGRGWLNTIREQRKQVERLMRKNPSLKSVQDEEYAYAYEVARTSASTAIDMELDLLPELAPFTREQALTDGWLPENYAPTDERGMSAYDLDLHAWAQEQAAALRRRSANEIDWENVAEEIESLGKQQVAELRNRLEVLLAHLLKWAYQPERQGRSWLLTIREQRESVAEHLQENPSLKPVRLEVFAKAYWRARYKAGRDIDSDPDVFPSEPPFTLEQALQEDWLPEPAVMADAPPG